MEVKTNQLAAKIHPDDLVCLMAAILLSSTAGDADTDSNTLAALQRAREIYSLSQTRRR